MNNRPEDQPYTEDPYYTLDTSLFSGTFRYFSRGRESVLVRGKVHRSEERYSLSKIELDIEPIATPRGTRTYLHMKPYVQVPNFTVTVDLHAQPKEYADQPPAIGTVRASHYQPKPREIEIGRAQAWYYPQARTLTIWECFIESSFRGKPLLEDENMKHLWNSFENFLKTQFPDLHRIVTPFDEPLFQREEYQQFLASLGYEPVAKAAYGKDINRTP
jgi:hypothetical protein